MMKGDKYMQILKIDNHKAKYSLDGVTFNSIVNIGKEELKAIIDYIMENNDAEFDEPDDEMNKIENKPEEIIQSDLYAKLYNLNQKKEEIIEKVDSKFSELIAKYELE